ncbi:PRP38 family-domain-containing protein [Gaertneriomyces semiglobifer]|nr:PRP38 family-domain-containing protein [Gaertneriomyces semiglobifer]
MSNRTVREAQQVHGQNPQFLIEKIIRSRIYDCIYWKEQCFALTAETIVDKAAGLTHIGGQYGNQRPTEFLCLTLKLLQLQPEKEIVQLYIEQEDWKYLRALGAFYLRLTGSATEIHQHLEPLLLDYRKLRRRDLSGTFSVTFMDEFVDELLRSDRVCDTILPRIAKRHILEENGDLEPRVSPLEEDLENESPSEDGEVPNNGSISRRSISKSPSRIPHERRNGHETEEGEVQRRDDRLRDRSRSRDRYRRDVGRNRGRSRSRSRSRSRRDYDRPMSRDTSRDRRRRSDHSRSRDRYRRHSSAERSHYPRADQNERHRDLSLPREEEREETQKKPAYSAKKISKLFKTKENKTTEKKEGSGFSASAGGQESMSIEETNKMRAALGLKPLKL